jgi:hypothetical protein
MGKPLLSPTMVSNKLLALAFIKQYLARHGEGPSYGEIAAELRTNRELVRKLVNRLASDGTIIKGQGPRSISLPGTHEDMLRRLRAAGWTIDEQDLRLAPPLPAPVTNPPLPLLPELDHIPDTEFGGRHGSNTG